MNALTARALRKSYGAVHALRGIDLGVAPGSIVALLGPNGAGKSTLLGCFLGTVIPDSGEMHFRGEPVTNVSRSRFGYLAERVALYPDRTVLENAGFIARLKGVTDADMIASLRRTGMSELSGRKVSQLSKGQLQRTGLAIALLGGSDVLLLDEPFNGLDPVVLESFLQILREEQQRGAAILLSTHAISVAEEIATEVAILLEGRLAVQRRLEDLRDQFRSASLELIYREIARGATQASRETHVAA